MGLKQTIIKAGNTLGTFAQTIQDKSLILVYGKEEEILDVDFANAAEREAYLKALPKINNQPSLNSITKTLQVINTYDVCNPANFAVQQVLTNVLSGAQGKINDVVAAFRGSNIVDSPQTREAFVPVTFDLVTGEEVESIPFQTTQKINLVVPFEASEIINKENIISRGSYVTLTQTDDPKSEMFYMKGTIDSFTEVNDPINGIEYTINIDSMGPGSEPPYQIDQKGNLIKNSADQPIPRQFFNWKIESESKISGNSRQLAEDLNNLTSKLREVGISDLVSSFNDVPFTLPGIANIQKAISEVDQIINNQVTAATTVANATGTAALALEGGLTTEQVILRVRVLRDFYNKLLPYTNLSFAIQEVFKKQIASINNALRNAIPYEQLAQIVKAVVALSRMVLGIINIILAGLKIINAAIKTVMVVLKVVKIVLKIIKKLIKLIPARWSTIGKIESITNKISEWQESIQKAIDTLKNISDIIQNLIGALTLVKRYLVVLIKESSKFAAKLESCGQLDDKGLTSSFLEANRNNFFALKNLIEAVPQTLNVGNRSQAGANALEDGITTFTFGADGSVIALRDSVFGFDSFGNIIFYGDLISGATGINFEDTLGQEFRSKLQYYTFNKFKESQKGLIELAEKSFIDNQVVADPEDVFGNFQELYLGYTLKIQEEKPIGATSNSLIRRRGIALTSDEKIVVSTELTYSTDLNTIINELKYKLGRNLDQGLIGINTPDKKTNEISDNDALSLAQDVGANSIGINNEKASSNNRATSNIAGQQLEAANPRETRIGNQPFTNDEQVGAGAQTKNNTSSNAKNISLDSLITPITLQNQEEDPELSAVRDVLDTLGSVNTGTISKILSEPGNQNLTDEELVSKLKQSILGSLDPNPDKVEEVKKKTQQWYEGLQQQTKIEWEQLFMQSRYNKEPVPPFEIYYDTVEKQELPKWVKLLLRNRYTETEVDYGISQDEIRDKYKIVIKDDGSVEVTLRPAFGKKN
jgi:gas vesicle protein